MNVETIKMPQAEAKARFEEYRTAVKERHTAEDEAIMKGYKALSKGHEILDINQVMKKAGMDQHWQPRLAVCRADATNVFFKWAWNSSWIFSMKSWRGWGPQAINIHATRQYMSFPQDTFEGVDVDAMKEEMKALLPSIPPSLRPAGPLSNYHILWEPEWEKVPPKDPFLLRRLKGPLFAVLAQWDLTEVERSVLAGRFE